MSDPLILHVELDATTATAMLHAAETEAKRLGLPAPQTGTRELGPLVLPKQYCKTWLQSTSGKHSIFY